MTTTVDAPATRGAATRERILDAATELFYAHGIRATSADRIIERAGITKVTFYRHFPTKDDVIVSYLARCAAHEREAIQAAKDEGDVFRMLDRFAALIVAEGDRSGFHGCAFINAAAEYADPAHPVRRAIDEHRTWFTAAIVDELAAAKIPDAAVAGAEVVMLRDGAMVGAALSGAYPAAALAAAFRAVVEAHRVP